MLTFLIEPRTQMSAINDEAKLSAIPIPMHICIPVPKGVFPEHGGRLRSPCLICRNGTSPPL
ncbi:hypothetical protein UUU_26770 (plasmid) [Klebsiella pneumoniae subsp. pneumoniae DSM 30104 = JCM 1662 = NBRC 14940]|nr:hypothetical protein UUU_26770 [Klebsiella pneumoniae subsp. pneumoniae DSM 30104 = JCM 1662 = NBRC 14940]